MDVPSDEDVNAFFATALEVWSALPFGDDLPSTVTEHILAAAVGGARTNSKLLFDVVRGETGWSMKSLALANLRAGTEFEVALARLPSADKDLPPDEAGTRLLTEWQGIEERARWKLRVRDSREFFLLRRGGQFLTFQHPIVTVGEADWSWADGERRGLKGYVGGRLLYRWYPRGGQFFGRFTIPECAHFFEVHPCSLSLDDLIAWQETLVPDVPQLFAA